MQLLQLLRVGLIAASLACNSGAYKSSYVTCITPVLAAVLAVWQHRRLRMMSGRRQKASMPLPRGRMCYGSKGIPSQAPLSVGPLTACPSARLTGSWAEAPSDARRSAAWVIRASSVMTLVQPPRLSSRALTWALWSCRTEGHTEHHEKLDRRSQANRILLYNGSRR